MTELLQRDAETTKRSTFFSSAVLGIAALTVNASITERQNVRAAEAQDQQRQPISATAREASG